MNIEKMISVCDMIAKDAKDDAASFDGKPFTGKTVGEYFGNHGASIQALANMMKGILEDLLNKEQSEQVNKTA